MIEKRYMKNRECEKKNQVTSSLLWAYAERLMAQGVSLLVTIVLARLIAPEDFGAITIVTVFINIANTLAIEGFGTALIQKKDADELDYSSIFYFSLCFSLVMYLILCAGAPYIATFYEMPILTPVLRIMGIRIVLGGINSIQQAYISKEMKFKKFFVSTSFGVGISACVGIGMAYAGFGIWALTIQYVTNAVIDTIILTVTSGLRVKTIFSVKRLKELLNYGWKLVASAMMISVYSNIRDLVVGKKYSSTELAFYNKGNQFPSFIASNINTSISKVLFPTLASFQDDRLVLKRMTRKAISVGMYVLSPVLIGMLVIAEEFVQIVLTEEWLPAVFYFRIYCIIFLLQPLQTASLQAMKAMGKSELYLKLEVVKKIFGIVILGISVFAFEKMEYIAWGALVVEIFSALLNVPVNKKILDYKYGEQLKDVWSTLLLVVLMGMVVCVCNFSANIYTSCAIKIVIGVIFYVCISWLLKKEEFFYIKNVVMGFVGRKTLK